MEPKKKKLYEPQTHSYVSSRSYKLLIIYFCAALLFSASTNQSLADTYYLDADIEASGNGSTPQTAWKTIVDAQTALLSLPDNGSGDTVLVASGHYGEYIEGGNTSWWNHTSLQSISPKRIDWLVYKAQDPENPPVFSNIFVGSNADAYIEFDGIHVINNLNLTDDEDGTCVTARQCKHVNFKNMEIESTVDNLKQGISINYDETQYFLIDNCKIHTVTNGIWTTGRKSVNYYLSDLTISNCDIYNLSGSAIKIGGYCKNVIIDNNHVHGYNSFGTDRHGSALSIRSGDLTIINNVIHDHGDSYGFALYPDGDWPAETGYCNMLIESNLIYDVRNADNPICDFFGIGTNFRFNNNTIIGCKLDTYNGVPGCKYAIAMSLRSPMYNNGSGFSMYNNVIVGTIALYKDSFDYSFTEDNNIIWSILDPTSGFWPGTFKTSANGANTILVYDADYNEELNGDFFEGSGNFFVGGEAFDLYSYIHSSTARIGHQQNLNLLYKLAQGNTNAIDKAQADYAPINDRLGMERVGLPDIGCYEYIPDIQDDTPPSDPCNIYANAVSETKIELSWQESIDHDSGVSYYNIYRDNYFIDKSFSTAYSDIELNPDTTYTYAVSAVNGAGLESQKSTPVQATTLPDKTAPSIFGPVTPYENSLEILFSETLDEMSAEDTGNYSISGGITISSAFYNSADNRVTLSTSSHIGGTTYSLTVTGVKDLAGNPMPATTKEYLYNAGLVGFWQFEEGSGTATADSSGNGNTGTLANELMWTSLGELNFDGDNDYVNCGTGSNLNLTNSLTICARIIPRTYGQSGWGRIVDKGDGSTGFSFFLNQADSNLGYVVYGGSLVWSDSAVVTLNQLQHAAVVYNELSSTITFYVDGQPAGSSNYQTNPIDSSNDPLFIGIRGYDMNRDFDGFIDDVRVYNRALSTTEIQEIYNTGTSGNNPPTANNDSVIVNEDSPANIIDVLTNDKDAEEDTLTITSVTKATHGKVDITGGGTGLAYTPTPDYYGPDSFTYTISDGQGGIDTATVNVTVTNVPDAPALGNIGNKSVDENTTLTFPVNATDADGDTIEYFVQQLPEGASFGSPFVWTPDYTDAGIYEVTFIASDGTLSDSETIIITVNNVNRHPVAADDSAVTDEDNAVTTVNVLTNDTDADGHTLTITGFTQASHGTVTYNGDGTFTYTPTADYNGSDSYIYTISDGSGGSDTAGVNITIKSINDAPVAGNDSATTEEDLAVTTGNVLDNDTDVDTDTLSVAGFTQASHGTVVDNGNGTFTYTPVADYNGSDSFTYTVTDGNGGTDTATVTITVNIHNDPPVAVADSAVTDEDTAVTTGNVLDNDTDADGHTLTITGFTQASHGTVTYNGDGTFTYTPTADYNGSDSFTYTISDGNGGTDTATVNVTINGIPDNPVAVDDSALTDEDTAVTTGNVLANDTDADDDTLTVTGFTKPANGMMAYNGNGTFTYTPTADYNGSDSFTYTISDGNGGTDTATVNVTINGIPDNPVAADDSALTDEDTAVTTGNVLINDNDADGDTLTVTVFTKPANGTVVYNGDGTFTYTPTADYNGSDSFTYTISDGNGGTDTATIQIEVTPVNDPPDVSAIPDTLQKYEDDSILPREIELATDVDGDVLTYTYVSGLQATDYTLHVDVSDGTVTVGKDITIIVIPVPPTVISAAAAKFAVEVVFSEELEQSSAENTNNYALSSGLLVNAALLNAENDNVTLYTTAHSENIIYTLTITGVKDLAGNPILESDVEYTYDSGLVGLWNFNTDGGNTAQDTSGYDNTATLINGPVWTEQGDIVFDGIDDAVEIPTNYWNLDGGTIALWAYPEDLTGTHYLFGHTTGSGNDKIQLYTLDQNLNLTLGTSGEININNLNSQTWHHIALTWDTAKYVVYVDGIQKASGPYTGLTAMSEFADIGNSGALTYENAFAGHIDDARIYYRALTPDEVINVYLMSDESVRENKALAFDVIAAYPDGTGLTYEINQSPDGATFENGTFSWNPWYDQAGIYDIIFVPTDLKQPQYSQTVTVVVDDVQLADWYQKWLEHLGLL